MSIVRVRFAPSPTGALHVGGARTALFNYLFARKHKGQFVLRIEDTDRARNQDIVPILKSLKWLNLDWDEGPLPSDFSKSTGKFGPYCQSQRLSIYKNFSEKLIEEGKAFYCFLTETEAEVLKKQEREAGRSSKVISPYRDLSKEEALEKKNSGAPCSIRFKIPLEKEDCQIQDMVRGSVVFPLNTVGDFILIRSDGFPVYNFSCAIDDSLMKITHVFRGEEHLSNTLRQILIQRAFDWTSPEYGHLSLILGEDRKKLSKREGAENVHYFKEQGFLSEALLNFLALLGWNPGTEQEYFSIKELIESFSIERVNAAPAIFDRGKLNWLNSEHLKNIDSADFWERVSLFFEKENISINEDSLWRKKAFELLSESFKTFSQAVVLMKPLFKEGFQLEEGAKEVLAKPQSQAVIKSWKEGLEKRDSEYISPEEFKSIQKEITSLLQVKGKEFFQPLRSAILGKPEGIEIKVAIALIRRQELIQRALAVLSHFS